MWFVAVFGTLMLVIPPLSSAAQPEKKGPKRVVSLSPAVTEALYLLGMGNIIAGVTTFCSKPPEAKHKLKIGTVMEPDIEKIVDLQPDMVIAMSLTSQRLLKKMRDIGLNIITFDMPDTFTRLCDVFLGIGKATGTASKAGELVRQARVRVNDVRKRTASLSKPRVLVQIGSKPFFVATKDFFINDYIEYSGAVNVFKNAPSGNVSLEEAVMRNPDVIFVVTMGMAGEEERQAWKRFRTVNAVKTGRIYLIDSDEVCSPTPVSFARSLEGIAALLHPGELK